MASLCLSDCPNVCSVALYVFLYSINDLVFDLQSLSGPVSAKLLPWLFTVHGHCNHVVNRHQQLPYILYLDQILYLDHIAEEDNR
ncbi:Transmembrane 9 superfamily member 12 [Vigna angularis]|uniref:Transmembrane 9 superfamily member 12 n=1 Tax=Phaseolus angularis TaxID=3914 RepID=A0A8T0LAV0_PHAAN|nr:Transmembrane 9 superfamily member 12 [Vigna angularis]